MCPLLRICECVITAVLGGLPPGSVPVVRMRSCPRTRAYVARRTAEGKTTREIRRCLKRYIARELYRHLTRSMNPPVSP
jgi:hypothetical protein